MIDNDYKFGAELEWGWLHSPDVQWNEICAKGVEYFGCPGERYITDVNINSMCWWFKHEQDRTMFVLLNGHAKCIQLK